MANLNIDSIKERTFDAIVIGSGMSGGWAAKEFTDKGLKTLLVERGRQVEHNKNYPTTNLNPWEFAHNGKVPRAVQEANPIASRCYVFKEDAMHFVVKDAEHPYVQEKPFDWIRGYQVGGKSLLWARQTQRWSKYDFEGGTATWRSLRASAATTTGCPNCPTGSLCRAFRLMRWKIISGYSSKRATPTATLSAHAARTCRSPNPFTMSRAGCSAKTGPCASGAARLAAILAATRLLFRGR
jgi:choline dehydrogenase-like flavoprotein